MDIYDYETANELLESNKRFKRRKVATNTWIERSEVKEGEIFLILHQTAILIYYYDGSIHFDTDGWSSPTTIDRMNRFQRKINLYREKKLWWFYIGSEWSAKYPFYDGLIIRSDGSFDEFNSDFDCQVESKNFGYLMGRH